MIFLYPLKPFERIWDRIEKSKAIPRGLKTLLITLVIVVMLAQNIGFLLIFKQVMNLFGILLGYSPP